MDVSVGSYRAPINYVDTRRAFNTVRAIGATIVALASIVAMTWDLPSAPYVLVAAMAVTVDALYRRNHGDDAFVPLVLDVTAIAVALLVRGSTPSAEVAAFLYVIAASMLLLPLIRAMLVIVYAIVWIPALVFLAPLVQDVGTQAEAEVLDRVAMVVFISVIALLLYAAGREVHASSSRHAEALDTERRAVELRNEFVSLVSHELRTPLTSITGFTDFLQENWSNLDPQEIDEFLSIMRREETHLSNLVEDILVIPRLEAGVLPLEPVEVDLKEVAFETARLIFRGSPKEHNVSMPGGIVVTADPVRLRQILRNLLENARKYGGDQVLIEGEPQGATYRIVVSDNGPGVPSDHQDSIFEQFQQVTKGDARLEQGVGLGLPIARKLARAMGGNLWYESRFPTGARFCFTLPLAEATGESRASGESGQTLIEPSALSGREPESHR
jgi:signal transduction histidine kinase